MSKPFFASAQDAETAFYEALERGDLDAMMAVWAEEEEIVCIHPGGPRLVGSAQVRQGWSGVLQGEPRLTVKLFQSVQMQGVLLAIHSVVELISEASDPGRAAPVLATNVYIRGAYGWHMLVHHASPASSTAVAEESPDVPNVLH